MNDLLVEVQDKIALLTLNRTSKQNAFDNYLLNELQQQLLNAFDHRDVRVIILKANGQHFSAGADLAWMQSMANFDEEENFKDSLILGQLMYTLYHSPKPIIAAVQGAAYGGGAGLVAASTMAIAATTARFCFSETRLGLIPAVISPYVVKAIGQRNAQTLFMTAEAFNAQTAQTLNLVQHVTAEFELQEVTLNYALKICRNAPDAVRQSLKLVKNVANKPIDEELMHYTAKLIAQKRVSAEGQYGLQAFLNKETPTWN